MDDGQFPSLSLLSTVFSKLIAFPTTGQLPSLSRLRSRNAQANQGDEFQRLGFNVLQQLVVDPGTRHFLVTRRELVL